MNVVKPKVRNNPRYIKAFRVAKGMSMEQFATFVGIALSSVSKHERGINHPHESIIDKYVAIGMDRDRIIEEHGITPAR